jgi:Pectate lyase superfamily protein
VFLVAHALGLQGSGMMRRALFTALDLLPRGVLVAFAQVALPTLATPQVQGPLGPVWNVKVPLVSKGCPPAKGDGGTDDTPAINCFLAASGGGSVTISFPTGTYIVTGTLTVPTNSVGLTLVGDGEGLAVIRTTSPTADILSATNAHLLVVSGLQFESRITRTAGSCIAFNGVKEYTISDSRFIDCYNTITLLASSNAGSLNRLRINVGSHVTNRGIFIQNSQVIFIRDLLVQLGSGLLGGTNASIQLDSGTDGVTIETFQSAPVPNTGIGGGRGLWLTNTLKTKPPVYTRCNDCYIEGGTGRANGIQIDDARDFAFTNGYEATSLIGLQITGGTSIRFASTVFFNNDQHGVLITGGDRVRFELCDISDNGTQASNTYSHINASNVTHLTVDHCQMGNFLRNNPNTMANGIALFSAEGASLTNNSIDAANVTTPINDATGTSYKRGNRFQLRIPAALQGIATLSSGTATVNTTEVLATDKIFLTEIPPAINSGAVRVSAINSRKSFVITSTSTTDASRVAWEIVH